MKKSTWIIIYNILFFIWLVYVCSTSTLYLKNAVWFIFTLAIAIVFGAWVFFDLYYLENPKETNDK